MVKSDLEKNDLVAGYSAPSKIFQSMDLHKGDVFENKNNVTLKIKSAPFGDKFQVKSIEETELEKSTERILTDGLHLEEGIEFKKQYRLVNTEYDFSIDFALPIIRLAIMPRWNQLWELNEADMNKKEQKLNEAGWDIMWVDENDLEMPESVAKNLQEQVSSIVGKMEFQEELSQQKECKILKSLPNTRHIHKYPLSEIINKLELSEEESDIVVYRGRAVPRSIANLQEKISNMYK